MKLRVDRLATLYLVGPLRGLVSSSPSPSMPILMYHNISNEDESGTHGYYRTATAPQVFSQHMQYLQANGYQTCSLREAIDHLQHHDGGKGKWVVITFDDGYADFYRLAFPVMNGYQFSATVFLPTAYIGARSLQFRHKDCLTWAEIRELQHCGVSFGSHTVTHLQLRQLRAQEIDDEIVRSKQTIEDKTGCPVISFAYPFAFPQTDSRFTCMLRDSLLQAGYENGVCTTVGRATHNSDRLFMERLPINSLDDPQLFGAKLAGAYDWVRIPQSWKKTCEMLP